MTRPTDADEAEIESSKAPLLDHLIELRKRLIYSLLALLVGFVFCFSFADPIYNFLSAPLAHAMAGAGEAGRHLIFTQVYEKFFTNAKVGLFAGMCLAFPFIASQVWMFVAPGLYRHERRAFLPFLFASPALFLAGGSFVYYVMLPYALKFFLGFESKGSANALPIEMMAKVSDYFDFVTTLIFAFGITFQLPVALVLLGKVGIVNSDMLRQSRRYAIVGITALAAIFTPPDVFSMLSLMIPLIILYEASIWLVRLNERKQDKARKAADEEAEEESES